MTPDPPILGLAFLLGRCTEEWKGPWSDDSKEWTDEAKEKFDLKVKDDAGPKICIMHTNFQRWENDGKTQLSNIDACEAKKYMDQR